MKIIVPIYDTSKVSLIIWDMHFESNDVIFNFVCPRNYKLWPLGVGNIPTI